MVQPTPSDEYQPTGYFGHQGAHLPKVHCVGTSCDNLVAMDAGVPAAAALQVPETCQPPPPAPKPARSESVEVEVEAQARVVAPAASAVAAANGIASPAAEADGFKETGYYGELRRRSLDENREGALTSAVLY